MIEPLRLRFEVEGHPDAAFALWTERASLWWPPSHTNAKVKGTLVVFEPRKGGRVFERGPTGDETELGQILEWEPPTRLVYRWHIFSDSHEATEVEVHFVDNHDGTTTVVLEHRGWEVFDDGEARRDRNTIGWRGLIAAYVEACAH
jgi:uncharacterized protein YndB with AHSA1/START domain